jgi:hypothetical protein
VERRVEFLVDLYLIKIPLFHLRCETLMPLSLMRRSFTVKTMSCKLPVFVDHAVVPWKMPLEHNPDYIKCLL